MPQSILTNNVKAYKILFVLERSLRNFISEMLQRHFQDGWLKGVDLRILRKCERRAVRERETYHEILDAGSVLVIDYADFKDLKQIIIDNWSIFEQYFQRKELIENKLEELEIPRNIIAHNRSISNTEMNRIQVYANDLERCMNKKNSIQ